MNPKAKIALTHFTFCLSVCVQTMVGCSYVCECVCVCIYRDFVVAKNFWMDRNPEKSQLFSSSSFSPTFLCDSFHFPLISSLNIIIQRHRCRFNVSSFPYAYNIRFVVCNHSLVFSYLIGNRHPSTQHKYTFAYGLRIRPHRNGVLSNDWTQTHTDVAERERDPHSDEHTDGFSNERPQYCIHVWKFRDRVK